VPWVVTARGEQAVRDQATRLREHVAARPDLSPADIGRSLIETRTRFENGAVVLGSTRDDLLDGLAALAEGRPAAGLVSGRSVADVPVAFLFPGQGSQYAGMGRRTSSSPGSPWGSARPLCCPPG
jgi:acyl transferase domain-containing protein